jgi:hypothetical protein|nr:MAG TPA: SH3 domain protein [Caudoviricetes sp.]
MTATEFYNKYNGRGIDIDGAAGVQCVDLFKAFTKDNYGIYNYNCTNGYANGLWIYRKDKPYYNKFVEVSLNNLQNGDWVFWDKGSKDCKNSHVAMYYNGSFFGQNQDSRRIACLKNISLNGALGALRPKEYVKVNTSIIKYVFNCTSLNVRTSPNGKIVNSIANKTAVRVYEVRDNWARIQEGMWVSNNYLSNSVDGHIKSMEVTNCTSLNVREGAGTNYKVVGTLPVNCVVSVLETNGNWIRIGTNRWVSKKYLK